MAKRGWGETYDTAPKSAPSQSLFSASTVSSGSAFPCFWNVSKPASWCEKLNFNPKEDGRASRMRRPAGMTSRPMPSPGMRPIMVKISNWCQVVMLGCIYLFGEYGQPCLGTTMEEGHVWGNFGGSGRTVGWLDAGFRRKTRGC